MNIIPLNRDFIQETSLLTIEVISSLEGIYSKEAREKESKKFTPEDLKNRIADPNCMDFIVVEDDKVVGFIYGVLDANILFIQWVGIHFSYRKKNIMKSLLYYTENICKANNISKIWLDTNCKNKPAMKFFNKNGFTKLTKVTNFWYGHDYYFWIKQLNK